MILSVECNGFKATRTSGPNPRTAGRDGAEIGGERRAAETSALDEAARGGGRDKAAIRRKKSLSDHFAGAGAGSSSSKSSSSGSPANRCGGRPPSSSSGNEGGAKVGRKVRAGRGVAVVEESSDPYGDFRRSMVEMMMARKKVRDGDLSRLLRSYLSLNAPQHHPVIIKAYSDLYMGSSVRG